MKRHSGLLVLTLVLLAACSSGGSSAASGPVNFGVTSGLSSSLVAVGQLWLNGATAGAYVVNHNGGVLGRQIKIIPVDTAYDTIDAVTAVRKMLAVDNVSVSIGMSNLDYTDALPILNQAKMVTFTRIGSPAIDNLVMPYSYSTGPSDALEGAAMALLAQRKGYKKLALVFDSSGSAQTFPAAIQFAAAKLGLTIVASPAVPQSAPSYQAQIEQVIQAHPDAVLMQVETAQVGAFFDEWKTLGGTPIPIIGSDETLTPDWARAAGAAEINAHVVGVEALSTIAGPGGNTFTTTYQQLFNQAPGYFAVYAYDGALLASLAMNAANSTDPTVYRPFIDDVTKVASDHITCDTYDACINLLKAGHKIKYVGVGSSFVFNQYHRVAGDFASYLPPAGSSDQPLLLDTILATDLAGLY